METPRGLAGLRGVRPIGLVAVTIVIGVPSAPLLEPMLVLVLPLDLLIGILMLVLELLVKLGMLVPVEALGMRLCMLFLELVVGVTMLLVEMIMLPLVSTVTSIPIIPAVAAVAAVSVLVGIAVSWVIGLVSTTIARPDRKREHTLGGRGDRGQCGKCRGTA